MRLAFLQSLGSGVILEVAPHDDCYWKGNLILDGEIVELDRFPEYRYERIH
jgi:hypothetical protein